MHNYQATSSCRNQSRESLCSNLLTSLEPLTLRVGSQTSSISKPGSSSDIQTHWIRSYILTRPPANFHAREILRCTSQKLCLARWMFKEDENILPGLGPTLGAGFISLMNDEVEGKGYREQNEVWGCHGPHSHPSLATVDSTHCGCTLCLNCRWQRFPGLPLLLLSEICHSGARSTEVPSSPFQCCSPTSLARKRWSPIHCCRATVPSAGEPEARS